ncbi:MAG: hypothetical protein KGH94_04180 [Candidatus Micrarchaeota archaeon]|nr:hypothetical protein [Candidatus Micrarchaeota archaeon]
MARPYIILLIGLFSIIQAASAQIALNTSPAANWTGVAAIFPPQTVGNVRYNYADAAILQLGNGTYRMYYSNFTEASGQYNTQGSGNIDSAVTRDGIHWSVDAGARVTNPSFPCPPWQGSVMELKNGTIRLYAGCGVFQSTDGLNFTRINSQVQIQLPAGKQSAGSPEIILLDNGDYKAYWAYYVSGSSPIDGKTAVLSYASSDGFSFSQDPGVRIGPNLSIGRYSIQGASHPLAYKLQNGTWVMYLDTGLVKAGQPTQGGPTNPSLVAVSQDGMNWSLVKFVVDSSEIYGFVNGNVMVFGYYGLPQFQLPTYSTYYGGGLYYATLSSAAIPVTVKSNSTATSTISNQPAVGSSVTVSSITTTIPQSSAHESIISEIIDFFRRLFWGK